MSVFKKEKEYKRVIFNVDAELAERLEKAKEQSRRLGKKLDVDGAVDKALEKFLKKAEKKLAEMLGEDDTEVAAEDASGEEQLALPEPQEEQDASSKDSSITVINT